MKVLQDENGRVDFDAPVDVTDKQKNKFIEFFKENFENVEVEDTKEPDRDVDSDGDNNQKSWTVKDRKVLLKTNSNEEAAEQLDRSKMSVQMKRGSFQPEFLQWAKDQGYAKPLENLSEDMIEDFLEEEG